MEETAWKVIIMMTILGIGLFVGYQYHLVNDLTTINSADFDRFREVYHNDYITTIKLLIQDCTDIYKGNVLERHLKDYQGKHLGILYKCQLLNGTQVNLSLSIKYTQQFYEVS